MSGFDASAAIDATLKISLKTDTGFRSESTHRVTLEQWSAINIVLNRPDDFREQFAKWLVKTTPTQGTADAPEAGYDE